MVEALREPEKGEQGEHIDPRKTGDASDPLIEVLQLVENKRNKIKAVLPSATAATVLAEGTYWGARR